MGYGARTLLRIKSGICIDCQNGSAGQHRRCRDCRMKSAQAQRERYAKGRRWKPGHRRILHDGQGTRIDLAIPARLLRGGRA